MEKKLYRSRYDRVALGVCGGLANYLDVDPTIIRLICLILSPSILIYLILAFIIPEDPCEIYNSGKKRMYKSRMDRKFLGVCGGLGEYFNVDSTIIRIIWILLICCGSLGFWIYLIIAYCMPSR